MEKSFFFIFQTTKPFSEILERLTPRNIEHAPLFGITDPEIMNHTGKCVIGLGYTDKKELGHFE